MIVYVNQIRGIQYRYNSTRPSNRSSFAGYWHTVDDIEENVDKIRWVLLVQH